MHGPANAAALVAAITLLSCAQDARADIETGNTMLKSCTSGEAMKQMYCAGYVDALVEADMVLGGTPTLCVPARVTTGQTMQVYAKFLRENPAHLHKPAPMLFAAAMLTAFPCKSPPATTGSVPRQQY